MEQRKSAISRSVQQFLAALVRPIRLTDSWWWERSILLRVWPVSILQPSPGILVLLPILGFPRLEAGILGTSSPSRYVNPCLKCILMGVTFALFIAQKVANAVNRSAYLPLLSPFASILAFHLYKGSTTTLPYIDIVSIVGTTASAVKNGHGHTAKYFACFPLPVEQVKKYTRDQRSSLLQSRSPGGVTGDHYQT